MLFVSSLGGWAAIHLYGGRGHIVDILERARFQGFSIEVTEAEGSDSRHVIHQCTETNIIVLSDVVPCKRMILLTNSFRNYRPDLINPNVLLSEGRKYAYQYSPSRYRTIAWLTTSNGRFPRLSEKLFIQHIRQCRPSAEPCSHSSDPDISPLYTWRGFRCMILR